MLVLPHSGVTVQYGQELYSVAEEAGYVTMALVLDGNVSVPVTVTVRTLDLLDSSVGDAATGELLHSWPLCSVTKNDKCIRKGDQ